MVTPIKADNSTIMDFYSKVTAINLLRYSNKDIFWNTLMIK